MTDTKKPAAKPAATPKSAAKKTPKPAAPKGTELKVEGAKAFVLEGAPHQRRRAARDLAEALAAYADAVIVV